MPSIHSESQKKDKKYSRLLKNLLDIKGRDKSIFTKVDNITAFDVKSKFGQKNLEKMLNQQSFTIRIVEKDLDNLLETIKKDVTAEEIIASYEKAKERLFPTQKLLLKTPNQFQEVKTKLIEKLEEKIQKKSTRWKQFKRKIQDINIQENIWPLHIATLFVSIKTDRREIYAPLILKEVSSISIEGSKVIVHADDSWKINEKLIFLLNDFGYSFDESVNLKDVDSFDKVLKVVGSNFNTRIFKEDLIGDFKNIKSKEIVNTKLDFHPGVVFGIFKPSGGYLRKTMMKIIEDDKIDEIIDIQADKNIYKKQLEEFIENESENLYRIQDSNYSQDKALSSSLIQDTIIWGPPGTGKSQVIANIIANILMNNQTAVIMSQKKAALDVLKKRLGQIAPFALFILNDNQMVKAQFYAPLQKFIDMVENSQDTYESEPRPIITDNEIEALRTISISKKEKKYQKYLRIIELFNKDLDLLKNLEWLNKNHVYPQISDSNKNILLNKKTFIHEIAKLNNIEKKKILFFKKYDRNFTLSCKHALGLIKGMEKLNLNDIKELSEYVDYDRIETLMASTNVLEKKSNHSIDQEYISNYLGKQIISKINSWQLEDKLKYKNYKRFASAVRAGRRLPYKFANDHMEIIREIFPVIITTPETTFINWEQNSFDYAILDESSQMFLEIGLPVLYLSKIKVLAGDTQQMQPSKWFSIRDDAEEDEEDVPENADSLLDYAFDKGVFQVMLDQNYRSSSASLMSFSAKNFYNCKLEVIDDKNAHLSDAIEVININGIWEKSINIKEAQEVIKIAKEELDYFEKIIILTFNSPQRQYIEKEILESHIDLQKALESEQLMIRNIENIQGDEANLVIASVVYDKTTNTGSTYVARQGGKNALNVAISRAKDKMIVVKSVNSNNIKVANSDDFKVFQRWLEFLDMDSKKQKEYSKLDSNLEQDDNKYKINVIDDDVESGFEQDVIDYLGKHIKTKKGVTLVTQYEVGSKRIDIAFLDRSSKFILGVEVDGYRYHNGQGYDKYLQDISRQDFLESKGYNIHRISEIEWKIDRQNVANQINELVNKN